LPRLQHWFQPGHGWQKTDAPYYPLDTPEELAGRVNRIRNRIEAAALPAPRTSLVISETDEAQLIGHVSRYWESETCRSIYLGVTIFDEAYWGRGLGTEALTLWTDYLFRTMDDVMRLGLQTWSGNPGMMRAAEKAGYSLEGRLRLARPLNGQYYDGIIMGVLRSEWEQRYRGDISFR
jgi:RimJ/RimL family protein N-acetyltransferase